MSGDFVVDTSVLAKFFFEEPHSVEIRRWVNEGHGLIAPRHLFVELASVAHKKVRDGLADIALCKAAVARAPQLLSEAVDVEPMLAAVIDLALTLRVSLYDAMFAVLATDRGVPLITADVKLLQRLATGGYPGALLAPSALA